MNFLKAPVDAQNFIQTFSADQGEEIRDFFQKYGFVCIENVLNDKEIDVTCKDFFALFDASNNASIEDYCYRCYCYWECYLCN